MSLSLPRPARAARRLLAALGLTAALGGTLVSAPVALMAQGGGTADRISGTVTDEGGQPLVGAQVSIPATRQGAVTGNDGRYAITGVAPGTYQVRVQRLGYAPREQSVTVVAGQGATADFQLAAVATNLAAQVVVGYTTQSRRDVSGAVASVRADEIADQKVATVEEALRGRVPGVQISASGEPGRPAQVIIRGQNFVSGSVSPLYVVDGMYLQQNPNLNPDDIASIEVLKDASAAAQYGAQAANGVIVITTKRGSPGENRIELRSYYGYQSIPKRIDMMNATQWAEVQRMAYQNAGQPPIAGALNPARSTDWQSAVFRSGAIQDHNLSVSGGTPTASYMISGGYLDQRGAILQTGFQRYSFRVNSEGRRGRLTLGENIALSQSTRQGLNGFPLIDVVRMLPTIPVYDPNNPGGFGYGDDDNPTFGTNPVGLMESQDGHNRSNQVIGTVYADVGLFSNLRYRLNLGLNYDDYNSHTFNSIAQLRYRTTVPVARLTEFRSGFTSLLYENLLTFDDTFGAHKVNAVAGLTEQKQNLNRLTAYREGYSNENLRTIDAGQTNNLNNGGNRVESALRALLLRANYSFKDRYLFTGSVRRDGSSRFAPGNRYANFAAGSLGWVMSDEGFYKQIPLLGGHVDYFKLRGSTGVLGNQDIGDYQFDAPVQQNLNYLLGNNAINGGATQLSLANPNIKWQSNRQTNVGADLGLLGDRVSFTLDYYVSTSDGLLVNAPIPWSLGAVGSPVVNAGSVRNSGLELGLTNRYTSGGFQLNTTLTLTTTKNRVLSLGNGGQDIFDETGVARTSVGKPIGEFYVLKTDGIFQSAAEVAAHTTTVKGPSGTQTVVIQPNAKPGDIRFADLNGDGKIDLDDRYDAGNGIPKLTGGLFIGGQYRALDFGVNLRGAWGNKIFNVVRYWTDRMDDPSNFRADLKPWTPENPNTKTPRAVIGPEGAMNATLLSDRWIESGSYVRLQNVTLGYTLPSRVVGRVGMADAQPRIYVNLQNIFTSTKFSNWDPETLGFGNPLGRGIDDGYIFPNVRTITFGLDVRL